MTQETKLLTENLAVGYQKQPLISSICMQVQQGEIVSLIGPNGAGKSTILKTVAGLLEPVEGMVYLGGNSLETIPPKERAKYLATMMTSRGNLPYATCYDVVRMGRFPFTNIMGTLEPEDEAKIQEAMESVGAWELRHREFSKISDGQKQRVLLARAIAQEPKLMILDEPTSYLDIGYKLDFMEHLRRMVKEKQIGVLMSMHELELVYHVADRVATVTADGALDRMGSVKEIFQPQYLEMLFHAKPGSIQKIYGDTMFAQDLPSGKFASTLFGEDEVKAKFYSRGEATSKSGKKTKYLMVQGTMSSAGKSLLVAGLCRIFKQDGYRVAPFKSQNMALNSFITEDGLEMGRAQVMQAEAAGIKPSVYMNPILLKPTDDCGSQVIVNGKVLGNMPAREYFQFKKQLIPEIEAAISKLEEMADIIVIEGAGSPAEINLKSNDIVNMGMAELVDAPVLLVGDIDRGGVFAQLIGTVELLEPEERARIKGLIVNKFRGDPTILDPGIAMLEERSGIPVTGVIPYMNVKLDDEDSLTERFHRQSKGQIQIGIVHLPHISNFTDFDAFDQVDAVSICYITSPQQVESMDFLILPGSKNTIADMKWLKSTGIETALKKYAAKSGGILGICGGYQMLGRRIRDPYHVESGGEITGLDLLPVETVLLSEKCRRQTQGIVTHASGMLADLEGISYRGYEIHMGETKPVEEMEEFTSQGSGYTKGNIYGTYQHGFFDKKEMVQQLLQSIAKKKGVDLQLDHVMHYEEWKEQEYDKLADTMRQFMNMEQIYEVLG